MKFKESKSIYLQIADRICDEILQGVFQRAEPVHEPISDGRDAKGRNEKRKGAQTLS